MNRREDIYMNVPTTRLIKMIGNLYQVEVNKNLKDRRITQSQAEVLIYIQIKNEQGKEVHQVDLEQALHLSNPTVTGILNRLEEKGFVRRVPSSENSKFKSVIITEDGKEELNKGKKVIHRLEKETLSCLEDEEQKEINRLLKKIWNHINAR